jgi:hypothetical protein
MAGYVLHVGATVMCMHGGTATPAAPLPRVKVAGQQAIGQTAQYTVAGCALTSTQSPPCVTAMWAVAATRVQASGVPLVIQSGTATCVSSGAGLLPVVFQTRVQAT